MSFPNLVATQTFAANIDGALPGRVLTCQSNGGSSIWADPNVPDPLTVNNLDVSTATTLGGDLFITASLPANVGDLLTCTNATTGEAEWVTPQPVDPLNVNTATVNSSLTSTTSSVLGGALRITGGTPTTGQFLQCTSGTGTASWADVTSPDPLTVNTATVNTSLTSTTTSVLGGTLRITGGTPTTGQFLQCTNGGTGAASWAAVPTPDPLTVNTATVNTSLTSTTASVLGGTLRITGGTPTTGQFLQCTNGGTGAASWAAVTTPDPLTVNTATVNTSLTSTASSVLGGALRITGGTPTTGQFLQCTNGGTGAASWAAVPTPDPLTVNTATVNTSLTSTAASVLGGTLRITGGTPTTGQYLQCTNGGTGAASWAALTVPSPLTVATITASTQLNAPNQFNFNSAPGQNYLLGANGGGTPVVLWRAFPANPIPNGGLTTGQSYFWMPGTADSEAPTSALRWVNDVLSSVTVGRPPRLPPGGARWQPGSASQSGTAVVGVGTAFNNSMVGSTLTYSTGASTTIASVTDATHLTAGGSLSIAAGTQYNIRGTLSQSGTTVTGFGTFESTYIGLTITYSTGQQATIVSFTNNTTVVVDRPLTVVSDTNWYISNGPTWNRLSMIFNATFEIYPGGSGVDPRSWACWFYFDGTKFFREGLITSGNYVTITSTAATWNDGVSTIDFTANGLGGPYIGWHTISAHDGFTNYVLAIDGVIVGTRANATIPSFIRVFSSTGMVQSFLASTATLSMMDQYLPPVNLS